VAQSPRIHVQAPPSVLVVVDELTDNGSLRWIRQLCGLWVGAGWSVRWFSLKSRVDGEPLLPPPNVALLYGDTKGARFRTSLPRLLPRLLRTAGACDVVLVISEVGLSMPMGYLAARVARRPFVAYVQSIPEHSLEIHVKRWVRRIWRHCLVRANAVLAVSPEAAASSVRLGVASERITVARTAIDVRDVQQRASVDAEYRRPGGNAPVLVACGELHPRKGYDLLVRALASVRQTGRRATLVLIGRGKDQPALAQLANDLGVSDSVLFLGHVENPLPVLAEADVFVHAARVEAVGLVLLEAVALGVPVIAADCEAGGPRMVLAEGRLGRLVEPESVSALAEAICGHIDSPTELLKRVEHSDDYLREHFCPQRTSETCLGVFAAVLPLSRRQPQGERDTRPRNEPRLRSSPTDHRP
jgi:glycosyltransferase involved in cell wall biosynthesis